MSDAMMKLARARTALVLDSPFFGTLALHLEPRESDKTETMATDGRSLFFNAAFVEGLTDSELVGLYAHEVMHPAMQHHTRREGRDATRWNIAADYAINPVLVEAGFVLPKGALIDSRYAGMSSEQIYDRLPPSSPNDESQPGEVMDAPDPATDEAEWKVTVQQAVQTAKMMGACPAGIESLVERVTKPAVDWKAIMRRFVQNAAMADYSWKMPNVRYMAQGIYLPQLRSELMPPLVVFLDTSGSTRPFMDGFLNELRACVDECQPERVYIVHVDAAVHKVEVFERGDEIPTIKPVGLGGTDFNPAFEWADREQVNPACALYITDGEGAYPKDPPDYPVLWALSNPYPTPWGENVVIQ